MSRGALSALSKKVVDFFQGARLRTTVLYNGSKYTGGGEITLSDNISNYDLLVVYLQTNVDYFVDYIFIGNNLTIGKDILFDHGCSPYFSWITLTPGSTNKMYVNSYSSNVNWKLGVIKVVGVKFVGGGTN